jgi:hypothetical protein
MLPKSTMTWEEVYAGTYVRYGSEMYGNRNYHRPPLDEADVSQISVPYEYLLWARPAKARH